MRETDSWRFAPWIAFACSALLSACGKEPDPSRTAETETGRQCFEAYCVACHGPEGLGTDGRIPPLEGSPWVAGHEGRPIRIVLHGLRGASQVGGATYDLEMPGFGAILTDEQIAAVLSHVRGRFGGGGTPGAGGAPVGAAAVGKVRAETSTRDAYWTPEEILEVR